MNRQDVMDHLQIIRTWAAVGKDPIYQGIEPKCCEDVEKWIDETLELLKEHEPKPVIKDMYGNAYCPHCSTANTVEIGLCKLHIGTRFCPYCGRPVKFDA